MGRNLNNKKPLWYQWIKIFHGGKDTFSDSFINVIVVWQIQKAFFGQLNLNQVANFTLSFELWNHPPGQSNCQQLTSQMLWFLFSSGACTSSAPHFHLQKEQNFWLTLHDFQNNTTMFMCGISKISCFQVFWCASRSDRMGFFKAWAGTWIIWKEGNSER